MKVCLIGYGKMGKAIEEILLERSHEIIGRIDHSSESSLSEYLIKADVVIEFTKPEAAVSHLKLCFDHGVPVICGTTGWLLHWNEITEYLNNKNGALIFASNFSVGVQLFFELSRKLAKLMSHHVDYKCSLKEIHHIHKKDAPSGTAITLANDILTLNNQYNKWVLNNSSESSDLNITSERTDSVVGTHIVSYTSDIDLIEIKHDAFNRKGFALGAVLAAEWILNKKGVFTMRDVLGL